MNKNDLDLGNKTLKPTYIFSDNPPKPEFVLPGFMPSEVGVLTGYNKTTWLLEAAMGVAGQVEGCDLLGIKPKENYKKHGDVAYFNSFMPLYTLEERLYAISKHIPDENAKTSINEHMDVFSIYGYNLGLTDTDNIIALTNYFKGKYKLVIFDRLPYTVRKSSDIAKLALTLERMAAETDAAILYTVETMTALNEYKKWEEELITYANWEGTVSPVYDTVSTEKGERRIDKRINFDTDGYDYKYDIEQGGVLVPSEK